MNVSAHFRTATALFVLLATAAAAAQEEAASTAATDAYVEGLLRSMAGERAGAVQVTLAEAVAAAVRNNPGILAEARRPEQAALEVLEATGVYDARIRIEGTAADTRRLSGNRVDTGLDPRNLLEEIDEDQYTLDVGVSKLLETGTEVDVGWTNRRRTTDAALQLLSPAYDPTLGLSLSQPLLKNFGGLRERTTVVLARNTSRRAVASYEAELARFVESVADAYWAFVQAQRQLSVREHALRLADELAVETRRRVDVGSLPAVAAREAEADAAARREEAIRAGNDLDLAARTLQYRVLLGATDGRAPLPVAPAETHVVSDVALDRERLLRTAVERRPEVRDARLALAAARLRERLARDELRPDLALVAEADLLGLGGEPVDDGEHDSYADALDRMASGDYYSYALGLRIDVPLSNTEARARHARESIEVRRSEDELRRVISDVALDIERSVGDVRSARERVEASRIARELAEENLRNQTRRYEVGMVTTTDVLEFQDRLTSAMAAEVVAITDHARALAALGRAEGTLLESYGIRVALEGGPDESRRDEPRGRERADGGGGE